MSQPKQNQPETDPRFPSGPWVGFFTQKHVLPGKHSMELNLSFSRGVMTGGGRDRVGEFTVRGRYDLADGKCHWTKKYLGRHDVYYSGYNEGKGIWGTWEIPPDQNGGLSFTGGFHIWPEGMGDPTQPHLEEHADVPIVIEQEAPAELIPAGPGR